MKALPYHFHGGDAVGGLSAVLASQAVRPSDFVGSRAARVIPELVFFFFFFFSGGGSPFAFGSGHCDKRLREANIISLGE